MKTSKDATDADAADKQKKARSQNDAQSDDAVENVNHRQAGKITNRITNKDARPTREKSALAREDVAISREEAANRRDSVAQAREDVAISREEAADRRDSVAQAREDAMNSREKIMQEADVLNAAVENHIAKLRAANEHLVITTVEAQAMTEEAQKAKDQMDHLAHHDFLTGLPNRILFKERLIQAIALAKRHRTKLAVLFMDLDRFKTINGSLGHAVGDELLKSVAQRLMTSMRSADTVSRRGGDELVVLLSEVADEKAVSVLANKVRKAVTATYPLAEQDLLIGATIGISIYPDDGEDAPTLIGNADVAMYHAKNSGGDRYQFFREEMNERAAERQRTEVELSHALEQNEFELYYQAQVEFQTGSIIGGEALIRWRHPIRGLLLPAVFIPTAEACGAIVPIGRWVLHEACRQTQAWRDAGLALEVVAVNISAAEFAAEDFVGNVRAALHDTGLAPEHLELELQETVLMKNAESAMIMLQEIKAMGVKIAIDDFGTGYSSLRYLRQFPVDTLKIDQSFVPGVVRDDDDDILVDVLIGLGKSLRHRVIAEGIETHEQLAFLSDHHCAEGQGNYLSSPMIADDFSVLIKSGVSVDLLRRATLLH